MAASRVYVLGGWQTDFSRNFQREGQELLDVLRGFGHRTAPIALDAKLAASRNAPYVFPHVRGTIEDALHRARLPDVFALDAVEVHD